MLLDAAYTDNVLPGSHIDIYVNDNIASTVPITTTTGGILRHLPIRVTMRHFKPGLNSVAIEAILMTKDDAACAPGATAGCHPALCPVRYIRAGDSGFRPRRPASESGGDGKHRLSLWSGHGADAALHRPRRCRHAFGRRHVARPDGDHGLPSDRRRNRRLAEHDRRSRRHLHRFHLADAGEPR